MKNSIFKMLLACGPKKKFFPGSARRILIVSTTGLGDSLWGTPALRALKKKNPEAEISLLTSLIGEQVYRNSPHLKEIFVIKDPALPSCIKLLPTLRKKQFDTALVFHTSQRPILPLLSLAGPSQIIGTEGINKGLDDLLTTPLPNKNVHEIERRLEIAGLGGEDPHMELFLTEEENETALKILPSGPPLIGMHIGAKDRFKQWSPKHFSTLGQRLTKEKGATLILTGDQSEALLVEEVANTIPRALSVAGKLSVRETAALIEKCALFITNDTGPMHLAFAMRTPTLALFSPTNPKLCGPYKIEHGIALAKAPTCTPCIQKKCQAPFCMEQFSPNSVYEKAHALLP